MNMMNNSKVDFGDIKLLCVDNPTVRNRVLSNKKIQVQNVPCILVIYPSDGSVEKYDGSHAVRWVETVIENLSPPLPPPQPTVHPRYVAPPLKQEKEITRLDESQRQRSQRQDSQRQRSQGQESEVQESQGQESEVQESQESDIQRQNQRQESDIQEREEMIQKSIRNKSKKMHTPIEEIVDEGVDDRHRNPVQPRRIRQDEGKFLEDDELFQGEMMDHRREPKNAVKSKSQKNVADQFGTRAKAEEIAKNRDDIEENLNKNGRSGLHDRRP